MTTSGMTNPSFCKRLQHKIIFDLISDLRTATEAMADRKVLDTLFDVIENYVFRHFEAEEELIRKHKNSMSHCLEHYGMIKEFRKFRLSFRNRNNPGECSEFQQFPLYSETQ